MVRDCGQGSCSGIEVRDAGMGCGQGSKSGIVSTVQGSCLGIKVRDRSLGSKSGMLVWGCRQGWLSGTVFR